jgi:photosystem II stability/assembly factor-like uncharacterized protein
MRYILSVLICITITIQSETVAQTGREVAFLPDFQWVYPTTSGGDIYDIYMADDEHGIVVGEGGYISLTSDGWNTSIGKAIIGCDSLLGASGYRNGIYLAVGTDGLIITSSDYGMNWTHSGSTFTENIYDIYAVSPTDYIICGDAGLIARTSDGGATWIEVKSKTTGKLYSLNFFSATIAYCLGGTKQNPIALKTTDGGFTWDFSTEVPENEYFSDIAWFDESALLLSGSKFLRSTDGGQTWPKPVAEGTQYEYQYSSYSYFSIIDINRAYYFIDNRIYHTTDKGATWKRLYEHQDQRRVRSIVTTATNVFAVGEKGLSYKVPIGSFIPTYTGKSRRVSFISVSRSGNSIIALSNDGGAVFSRNSGMSWDTSAVGVFSAGFLLGYKVVHADSSTAFALAQGLRKSTDGGATWSLDNDIVFEDIGFCNAQNGIAKDWNAFFHRTTNQGIRWVDLGYTNYDDIKCFPSGTTLVTSSPRVLISTDLGSSWTNADMRIDEVLDFTSENQWLSSNSAGLKITTDGGKTINTLPKWITLPSGVFWHGAANIAGHNYLLYGDKGAMQFFLNGAFSEIHKIVLKGDFTDHTTLSDGSILLCTTSGGILKYSPKSVSAIMNTASVSEMTLRVRPTISSGIISLDYGVSAMRQSELVVLDLLGRKVFTCTLLDPPAGMNSLQINLSRFGSGIYFARLYNAGAIRTVKFIIQR